MAAVLSYREPVRVVLEVDQPGRSPVRVIVRCTSLAELVAQAAAIAGQPAGAVRLELPLLKGASVRALSDLDGGDIVRATCCGGGGASTGDWWGDPASGPAHGASGTSSVGTSHTVADHSGRASLPPAWPVEARRDGSAAAGDDRRLRFAPAAPTPSTGRAAEREGSGSDIRLSVFTPASGVVPLEAKTSDLVGAVKQRLMESQRVDPERMALLLEGQELADASPLSACGIAGDVCLRLAIREPARSIRVTVRKVSPLTSSVELDISSLAYVSELKRRLQAWDKTPEPSRQRLVFGGQELADGLRLASYEVKPRNTLHLLLR